jgi:hypothetical protein
VHGGDVHAAGFDLDSIVENPGGWPVEDRHGMAPVFAVAVDVGDLWPEEPVSLLSDPRLRGKPIAVGGGVVLAASYEARAFGVRSGMPGRRARQLCPDLVFVGGHFDEYQRLGDASIEVLSDFAPWALRP